MRVLLIINDAPYGTEKAYTALRLAITMQKEHPDSEVNIFLMADATGCALPNQTTPQGYYNIERMLKAVIARGGRVKACGTCIQARGLGEARLVEGVESSTMSELANLVAAFDRVLTF